MCNSPNQHNLVAKIRILKGILLCVSSLAVSSFPEDSFYIQHHDLFCGSLSCLTNVLTLGKFFHLPKWTDCSVKWE